MAEIGDGRKAKTGGSTVALTLLAFPRLPGSSPKLGDGAGTVAGFVVAVVVTAERIDVGVSIDDGMLATAGNVETDKGGW